jgi:hypothetical protein
MSVFRCVGRIVTIFALCCAMGLHWMALQSVAWTTMLVQNAKHTSLCKAIVYTLDGAHPCSLCHAVNAGKNSEKKSDLTSATVKIDMICAQRPTALMPPVTRFDYPTVSFLFSASAPSPLVPPPRSLLS